MRASTLAVLAIAGVAAAQVGEARAEERYRLERTDDGYVRMDTRTGEMWVCREQADQLVCRTAADERDAYDGEIERLNAEMDALTDRVAALEAQAGAPVATLPSDEEFDRTLGFMERFFRRFVDVFRDLDRELREDDAGAGDPDRT